MNNGCTTFASGKVRFYHSELFRSPTKVKPRSQNPRMGTGSEFELQKLIAVRELSETVPNAFFSWI